jgi:hypothetical protein
MALEFGLETNYRPSAIMILSKPENEKQEIDNIYEDCYLLELEESDVESLLTYYGGVVQYGHQAALTILINRCLKRGQLKRDED